MNRHRSLLTWVFAATAILAAAAWPAARAQDDGGSDDEVEVERTVGAKAAEQLEEIALLEDPQEREQAIKGWKSLHFGGTADPRRHLEQVLEMQLADLKKDCDLSEIQQQKLRLAGHGDIKRFVDRLQQIAGGPSASTPLQALSGNVLADLEALDKSLKAGFFVEGSLFAKVLATTLSADQFGRRSRGVLNRNAPRYAEAVRQWIGQIGNMFALRKRQCDELAHLIIRETSPPRRFGQSDYAMVMYQMSKVPEDRIKAIVTESQWNEMRNHLSSWAKSAAFLKESGFVFDDLSSQPRPGPAPPPAAAAQAVARVPVGR